MHFFPFQFPYVTFNNNRFTHTHTHTNIYAEGKKTAYGCIWCDVLFVNAKLEKYTHLHWLVAHYVRLLHLVSQFKRVGFMKFMFFTRSTRYNSQHSSDVRWHRVASNRLLIDANQYHYQWTCRHATIESRRNTTLEFCRCIGIYIGHMLLNNEKYVKAMRTVWEKGMCVNE